MMEKAASRCKTRCAIYTRKSSEEGLDQDFNSLDAQREACASYIASQKHEGWVLLPSHYDDGGISGGTLERPGLQQLMQDIDGGLVDQIVVYKIDRLTRSLADFARLVDRLDHANASFVSVTQSFNTATSMGRLTLNVLLSFAQFEREVTAERIRDKIAASKKKGLWMGGNVPLGYDADGRTLKINQQEAETIKDIYGLYEKHENLTDVLSETRRLGLRTKIKPARRKTISKIARQSSSQATVTVDGPVSSKFNETGNIPFSRGHLHYILTNPVYAGLIRHKDIVHEGQHEAIIDPESWNNIQAKLKLKSSKGRGEHLLAKHASPLAGKIFDDTGDRLTPTHTNKNGKRHRYYVSNRLISKHDCNRQKAKNGWRLPAHALEQQLTEAVINQLKKVIRQSLIEDASADKIAIINNRILDLEKSSQDKKLQQSVLATIDRCSIKESFLQIELSKKSISALLGIEEGNLDKKTLGFPIPFQVRKRGVETKFVIGGSTGNLDRTLIKNIIKANDYYKALKSGKTIEEIAARENLSKKRVIHLIDMAFIAPDIVKFILQGEQPTGLTTEYLRRFNVPSNWCTQREIFSTL